MSSLAAETRDPGYFAERLRWEIYFAISTVAVAVFCLAIPTGEPLRERWAVLGVFAVMVLWYLLMGRPTAEAALVESQGWVLRSVLFHAVLLALFVAGLFLVGTVSMLLFALCPMVYMSVGVPVAHGVVALYAFAPAAVSLVLDGPRALPITATVGLIATTISIVIAQSTIRTERISEQRAQLIRELESTRAQLAQLSHEAGIAAERERLAGEIHDTVAQGLSSVVMLIEAADAGLERDPATAREHLRLAARVARENLDETRAIVAALTPAALGTAPLADALRRQVERFSAETGIQARLDTAGAQQPLPTRTEVVLLRVAQEALHNVRKHAAATTVEVELSVDEESVRLSVRDDGAGFDPDAPGHGYGLAGMRSRVEQIGGALTVDSRPGQGTTIRTVIPR